MPTDKGLKSQLCCQLLADSLPASVPGGQAPCGGGGHHPFTTAPTDVKVQRRRRLVRVSFLGDPKGRSVYCSPLLTLGGPRPLLERPSHFLVFSCTSLCERHQG